MLKKILLYAFLRLAASIRSLFTTRREATITLTVLIIIGGAAYFWQSAKNQKLLNVSVAGDAKTVTAVVKDEGAYIAATDELGRTALHIAARYSNREAVEALLRMGAPVNAQDDRGRTPLHMTRYDQTDNLDIVRLLLEHGADPDAKDEKGEMPIDILRKQRRYNKPVRQLIEDYSKRKQAAVTQKLLDAQKQQAASHSTSTSQPQPAPTPAPQR